MGRRRLRRIASTVAVALAIAGCSTSESTDTSSGSGSPEKLAVGLSSFDASYGPLWYAIDNGIFDEYGVEIEIVSFDTGARAGQGVIAGAVDIVGFGAASAIDINIGGGDLRFIAAMLPVLSGNVYASPDITSPEQLGGKTWGISSFGSEAHLAAQLALTSWDLDPNEDVTFVQIGGGGSRFAALEADQVQVTTLLPPLSTLAEAEGFSKLLELPSIAPDYFSLGFATSAKAISERRPVLVRFLNALAKGTAEYKADREGGSTVLQKYLQLDDSAAAESAYDYYAPLHPDDLRPTEASVAFHIYRNDAAVLAGMTVDDVLDVSLLDELENPGGDED